MRELIVLFGYESISLEIEDMYKFGCIDKKEYGRLMDEINTLKQKQN